MSMAYEFERTQRIAVLGGGPGGYEAALAGAQLGAEVTLGLGPWDFHCRVVDVFHEDGRCGFTYGTLPGHLERGEETFTLERLRDGRTVLLIDAASEPFLPFLRPLVDVPRRLLISRLYLHALD